MPHHGAGVQSLALGACWGKPVWQAHGGQGTWKEADSGVPPGGLHPLGHPGEMPQNTAPRKSGAGRTAAQTPTSATPQACPAPPLPPPAPSSRTGPSLGPPFGSKCLFVLGAALLSPRVPEPGVSALRDLPSAASCFSPGLSPSLRLPPFGSLSASGSRRPRLFGSPRPRSLRVRLVSAFVAPSLATCSSRVPVALACARGPAVPASLHPSHPRPRPRPRRCRIAVLQGCSALRLLRQ